MTEAGFRNANDRRSPLSVLEQTPSVHLWPWPSPLHEMPRLRQRLGPGAPRLLIKRDDLIGFGFGGNKVRKLSVLAARALDQGADTLITTGGLQSNHARTTAVVAAYLGLQCHLVLNGDLPAAPTGNLRLARIAGARIHTVPERSMRNDAMEELAASLSREGRRPFVIPLGASTAHGSLAFARAFGEMVSQTPPPDAIVHASSSGGTQAGLLAGKAIHGSTSRILGISADDEATVLASQVERLLLKVGELTGLSSDAAPAAGAIDIDDRFVGEGYGIPTEASREAIHLTAECEGIFLDPTYTAKAMAGLIAAVRAGRWKPDQTVLFWHTGGVPALLA